MVIQHSFARCPFRQYSRCGSCICQGLRFIEATYDPAVLMLGRKLLSPGETSRSGLQSRGDEALDHCAPAIALSLIHGGWKESSVYLRTKCMSEGKGAFDRDARRIAKVYKPYCTKNTHSVYLIYLLIYAVVNMAGMDQELAVATGRYKNGSCTLKDAAMT